MSVHFFYNYKEELIKKLKEHFKTELEQRDERLRVEGQLGEAEKMIKDYFDEMTEAMSVIEEVSDGVVRYITDEKVIAYLEIYRNYVKFTRSDNTIEIKLGQFNEEDQIVESAVYAYVIPGDKKCKIKKVGKLHDGSHFDENTINTYVRKAFVGWFDTE